MRYSVSYLRYGLSLIKQVSKSDQTFITFRVPSLAVGPQTLGARHTPRSGTDELLAAPQPGHARQGPFSCASLPALVAADQWRDASYHPAAKDPSGRHDEGW